MLASITDFKTPEVMIWKHFDMGRGKKRWFGGCDVLGGWVVYCSILLVNVLWVNWNVWGKKNCLNILFEINTFNKVSGDGVGLGWSEVDWRGKKCKGGGGRIRLLSSSRKVYLNFICNKYQLVVLI